MLWGRRKSTQAFLLVVNPTARAARELKLNKPECAIGSDESNDLIIHDSSVSRRHALMRRRRNKWQVLDRQSANGTYIGDRKAIDWITLRDGQELRFGGARFIFRTGQPFDRSTTKPVSGRRVRASNLRLLVVLIPIALIFGFAAAQLYFYRSYQRQEASLHNPAPKH